MPTAIEAAAGAVVVVFGLCLVAFLGVAVAKPATARWFLAAFASSARAHYTEHVVRLLIGVALVVRSPAMWQPRMFRLAGWAIVISSVVLLCLPWQWHYRFGERLRPLFFRYLWLYVTGACAFGVLLLYGVLAGGDA